MDTKTADKITLELSTKSDKIRALDKAGYARADIARYLGIRYQHVRKVLVDEGVSLDTKKPKKSKMKEEAIPLTVECLLKSGFLELGEWALLEDKIFLKDKYPNKPAVYVFCENGTALYVGISSKNLAQRFKSYVKPGPTQTTSIRINALIAEKLKSACCIKIFVAHPEATEWNGLPVDIVTGLEAGMIERFKPVWNKRGI